jgi:predicted dehydrogenase
MWLFLRPQFTKGLMNLTRRNFNRLAITSAASGLIPGAFAQSTERRLRYAIVGLGRISVNCFMPAIQASSTSEITALVSGSPEKAKRLASQYGVPESSIYSYEQFDRIRENAGIDAVYIALPNGMHAEYTIRAAQAGKHVLCEKPMANTVEEAKAMIAACKLARRKLMIGYRCQLQPTTLHVKQLIQSGQLGKIQSIESANGFNTPPGEWRLNRKLAGGGPLQDVGIYSLNACRFLLGEEPSNVSAFSSVIDHDGRFDQVEETIAWIMKFPGGTVATCSTSYGADMEGFYRIHGSKGAITVQPAFSYTGIHMVGQIEDQPVDDLDSASFPDEFIRETDHFARCVLEDRQPGPSGEEGLKDMEWIAQIYKSAAGQS